MLLRKAALLVSYSSTSLELLSTNSNRKGGTCLVGVKACCAVGGNHNDIDRIGGLRKPERCLGKQRGRKLAWLFVLCLCFMCDFFSFLTLSFPLMSCFNNALELNHVCLIIIIIKGRMPKWQVMVGQVGVASGNRTCKDRVYFLGFGTDRGQTSKRPVWDSKGLES